MEQEAQHYVTDKQGHILYGVFVFQPKPGQAIKLFPLHVRKQDTGETNVVSVIGR